MNASGNYAMLMFQSALGFSKTVRNDQLPMEFWQCGIVGKVSKVVIFENTYLWVVTFGKIFNFCIFMLTYLFLLLKSTLKRQKTNISML